MQYNITYGSTIVANNSFYSPTGAIDECGFPLPAWQARDPIHNDPGSTAAPFSSTLSQTLVDAARKVLGL